MSELPNKRIKFTLDEKKKTTEEIHLLSYDVIQHIFAFYLPLNKVRRSILLSKSFQNSWQWCQNLDFDKEFSSKLTKPKAIEIIEDVFKHHKASKIKRFVLVLDHMDVEDKINTWIKTCVDKNVQELELDLSKFKTVTEISLDFWTIETLQILKLKWCKFDIPNHFSPKGLKILKTLGLSFIDLYQEVLDSVFEHCDCLEILELVKCNMIGKLSIKAANHKRFKSLVVESMPRISSVELDSPTLESYKYDGFPKKVKFMKVTPLMKDAMLFYVRNKGSYDSSFVVLDGLEKFSKVCVLTTTHIYLEALTCRFIAGRGIVPPNYRFENLIEFQVFLRSPTVCNLFDIAMFLKHCPKLKRIFIDINDFKFSPDMFWEIHQKPFVQNFDFELNKIEFVEIKGYKGDWHELDILQFFLKNAKFLNNLDLVLPKNKKITPKEPDYPRINAFKSVYPKVKINVFEDANYKPKVVPKHVKL